MVRTRKAKTRGLLAPLLLLTAVAVSACTAEQFWRGVYEGGRKACQNAPAHCTDNTRGDPGRGY